MGFLRKVVETAKRRKLVRASEKAQKNVFGASKKSVFDQSKTAPKNKAWDF